VRLLPWVLIALLVYVVITGVTSARSYVLRNRRSGGAPRTSDGVRRARGPSGPTHDAIIAFIESHEGVEAYVEPRTVVSPLTVVLVDADGAWRRIEMHDDRVLRPIVRSHGIRVFDASLVGYPPRMRRSEGPADG
jgi:hypothetical protein